MDGRRARDAGNVDVVFVVELPATDDAVVGFPVGDVVDVAVEHGSGILLPSFVASLGDNRGGCDKNNNYNIKVSQFNKRFMSDSAILFYAQQI